MPCLIPVRRAFALHLHSGPSFICQKQNRILFLLKKGKRCCLEKHIGFNVMSADAPKSLSYLGD